MIFELHWKIGLSKLKVFTIIGQVLITDFNLKDQKWKLWLNFLRGTSFKSWIRSMCLLFLIISNLGMYVTWTKDSHKLKNMQPPHNIVFFFYFHKVNTHRFFLLKFINECARKKYQDLMWPSMTFEVHMRIPIPGSHTPS